VSVRRKKKPNDEEGRKGGSLALSSITRGRKKKKAGARLQVYLTTSRRGRREKGENTVSLLPERGGTRTQEPLLLSRPRRKAEEKGRVGKTLISLNLAEPKGRGEKAGAREPRYKKGRYRSLFVVGVGKKGGGESVPGHSPLISRRRGGEKKKSASVGRVKESFPPLQRK